MRLRWCASQTVAPFRNSMCRWGFSAEPMRWFRVTASGLAPDETIEPECRITKVERARFTAASTCGQGFGQHVIDQLGG